MALYLQYKTTKSSLKLRNIWLGQPRVLVVISIVKDNHWEVAQLFDCKMSQGSIPGLATKHSVRTTTGEAHRPLEAFQNNCAIMLEGRTTLREDKR